MSFISAAFSVKMRLERPAELVGAKPLHLLTQTALPLKSPTGAFIATQTRVAPNTFSRMGMAYFWMAFIRPPAEMMFWIKGGKGSAWNTLPLVSSVMTPVSKST